ncbi:MAG TPA: GAF domain-containing protein [Terriglobales bacterium]|nr:GAF domain-containing protein [Terriglobales bacterium]
MKRLDELEELLNSPTSTVAQLCGELASIFGVDITEVGLLRLDGHELRFVFPAELQVAGSIPLSSSAVASQTAAGKTPELFNQFAQVPHHNLFESVKLHASKEAAPPPPIQKLMSAPILNELNETLGVVQISRKGATPQAAGPDFSTDDLETLERVARRIAFLFPEILCLKQKNSTVKLRFANTTAVKKKA